MDDFFAFSLSSPLTETHLPVHAFTLSFEQMVQLPCLLHEYDGDFISQFVLGDGEEDLTVNHSKHPMLMLRDGL